MHTNRSWGRDAGMRENQKDDAGMRESKKDDAGTRESKKEERYDRRKQRKHNFLNTPRASSSEKQAINIVGGRFLANPPSPHLPLSTVHPPPPPRPRSSKRRTQ